MSIYSLAVAPKTNNFPLKLHNTKKILGRLSFNTVFEQEPLIELTIKELYLELEGKNLTVAPDCVVQANVVL
jgi:hypothetical protein